MSESGNQEIRKKLHEVGQKNLSQRIIAAAIAVHQELGPGFLESAYETALCVEFDAQNIRYERQKPVSLVYRNQHIGEHRLDLLVEEIFIVELKTVSALEPVHFATVRSYLKATKLNDALIFNFASMPLAIKRVAPHRAPKPETIPDFLIS